MSIGRTAADVDRAKVEATTATALADDASASAHAIAAAYTQRAREDSASLSAFRDTLSGRVTRALTAATTANYLVLNRWGQVVDEERITPIADSHFWVRFDDIDGQYLTATQAWYDKGGDEHFPVPEMKRRLHIGDSVFTLIDNSRYKIVAQSKIRDGVFLHHNDRVVFRVERLIPDSTLGASVRASAGSSR
jgi:hypothetical protein